jgi:hypothetical protein
VPITRKAINRELAKHGHKVILVRGGGYYYFRGGETTDWLDRTVRVPTINSLTLDQWMGEFNRLWKLNQEIMAAGKPRRKRSPRK